MLRKASEFTLRLGETFKTSSGRESPARSTLALVLDGSDISLGNPVNIIDLKTNLIVLNVLEFFGDHEGEVGLDKFLMGEG